MNKLSTNLQFLMQRLNISVSELARRTKIPQPVLHRLTKGKTVNPNIATLLPIAKFFSISIDELIGSKPLHVEDEGFEQKHKTYKVPVVSWGFCEDYKKRQESVSDVIYCHKKISKKAYALRIKESKYEINDTKFSEESLIIVEPDLKPINRDYVIIKNKKNIFLRQLIIDGEDMYLSSMNVDGQTKLKKKEDLIIGVVVMSQVDYIKENRGKFLL